MAAGLSRPTRREAFVRSALRECRRLVHDRWDLALATWLPLAVLGMLAWLFSAGVPRALPVVLVDEDRSALGRDLARLIGASPNLKLAGRVEGLPQAWSAVRTGQALAVVLVPEGFSRELARGREATLLTWYDASHQLAGQAAQRAVDEAVQELTTRTATVQARRKGPAGVRPPPIRAQALTPGNPGRSYEQFLLSLLFPAVLLLAATLAMVSALGRELRDGTVAAWLHGSGDRLLPAVAGKLCPYLLLFTAWGTLSLLWLVARSGPVAGSTAVLLAGQAAMYLAYGGVSLLLVGVTRNLGSALSATGLYAGTALAFSGATFPTLGAPVFARIWSALLPLTTYLELQAGQLELGAPWRAGLPQLGVLLLFAFGAGGAGLWLYAAAARDPAAWGRR